jgi:hypothetical protein
MTDEAESDTDEWRIEGGQYGYMGEPATAEFRELYRFLTRNLERDRAVDEGPDGVSYLREETGNRLVQYFVIGSSIIEYFSSEILYMVLVDEKRQSKSTYSFFRESLRQWEREELLFCCGVIDAGLKGDLNRARDARSELVHSLHEHRYISEDSTLLEDVEKTKSAVDGLSEIHIGIVRSE